MRTITVTSLASARAHSLFRSVQDIAAISLAKSPRLSADYSLRQTYETLRAARPASITKALTDPRAIVTIRTAGSYLGSTNSLDNSKGWSTVLGLLVRLAISCNVQEGRPGFFPLSERPKQGVLVLPGLCQSFRIPDRLRSARVEVTKDGSLLIAGEQLEEDDKQPVQGFLIANYDENFLSLAGAAAVDASLVRPDSWKKCLYEATQLISKDGASASLVSNFARSILELRGEEGVHLSGSYESAPGVIGLSFSEDPLVLAEALVHEADHVSLFERSYQDQDWSYETADLEQLFKSPWRPDPRPMQGLVFGASAFVSVGLFWASLVHEESHERHDYIGYRSVRALLQSLEVLELAIQSLLDGPVLVLCYELQAEARETLARLEDSPGYESWRDLSEREMSEHSSDWERRNAHLAEGCASDP